MMTFKKKILASVVACSLLVPMMAVSLVSPATSEASSAVGENSLKIVKRYPSKTMSYTRLLGFNLSGKTVDIEAFYPGTRPQIKDLDVDLIKDTETNRLIDVQPRFTTVIFEPWFEEMLANSPCNTQIAPYSFTSSPESVNCYPSGVTSRTTSTYTDNSGRTLVNEIFQLTSPKTRPYLGSIRITFTLVKDAVTGEVIDAYTNY